MKHKLFITRSMPAKIVAAARAHFEVTHRDMPLAMDADEAVAALQGFDALLPTFGDPLGAATFARAGAVRCKLLASYGAGYSHIDVDAAKEAGVMVTNTPGAVTDATADIAVMLMLMAARRASEGEAMLRAGDWRGWEPTQLMGLHVSGKTLGIVGMGRIGQAIAKRCHFGFGMDVVFHNRSSVRGLAFPATQLDGLRAVAGAADVVIVAVPGGPETFHLIDANVFENMQAHAVFVNIARGDVVDEAALIVALTSGQIAGAGLDVYEFEPNVPEALRGLKNATLLPHMGTSALEVREAIGMVAIDNLIAWNEGRALPNQV